MSRCSRVITKDNKFLCYNSFKAAYFWGPAHLSEVFYGGVKNQRLLGLLEKYPGSRMIYLKDPDGNCFVSTTRHRNGLISDELLEFEVPLNACPEWSKLNHGR